MGGMKWNGFGFFIFAEMMIFTATIQGIRFVISATSESLESKLNRSLIVYACEDNVLTISCKENETIHIAYANYGCIYPSGLSDCNPSSTKTCFSSNSLQKVQHLCSGVSNCSVLASISVFGDPCVGTLKYLAVTHQCYSVTKLNRSLTAYACEHTELTISCKESEAIHIVYANYGRLNPDICNPFSQEFKPNCSSNNSLSIVRRLCSGKSNCSVLANNSAFGDPCHGILKHLTVTYQCHPGYNGSFCRSEQKRNVNWTDTRPDSTVTLPCPNNIELTKAERTCGSNAFWSNVLDLSKCCSKEILALQDKLENLLRNFSLNLVGQLMEGLVRASTGYNLYGGDLKVMAKIMVGAVDLTESSSMINWSDVDRILESVANTTSILLHPNNIEAWMDLPKTNQSSTATRLLWAVESSAALRAKSISEAQHFKIADPGLDVLVAVMKQKTFSTFFYIHDKVDYLSSIDILHEAGNGTGLGRVTVALFDAVGQWLHVTKSATKYPDMNSSAAKCDFCSESTPDIIVNTRVLSISIVPRPANGSRLKENVRFTLGHIERKRTDSNPVCVFWKYSIESFEGHWSGEGCRDVTNCSDCAYTVCECDHLTNFAVLMSVASHTMSQIAEHTFALSMMTYIGCTISIICLVLAFITFYWFKGLECDRNTIHKNLVLCLFIAEIIFLLGIGQYEHKELCLVVTGFLHYFFLASFSWMFVEGVQLYILLVEVFDAANCRLRWYYISAYGVPALIVFISAMATYLQGNRYAAQDYCWLSKEGGLIWAFAGPVAVIIFLNSLVLGVVIYTMHTSSLRLKQKSKTETIGSWARSAVVLMILLGSTWILGFLYVNEDSLFMAYIFTILNSLQGLFIFVFHCLTLEKIQKEYRRCIQRCTWLPEDVRVKYGGLNVTQFPSQNHPTESLGMPSSDYLDDPETTTESRKGSVDTMITHVGERA